MGVARLISVRRSTPVDGQRYNVTTSIPRSDAFADTQFPEPRCGLRREKIDASFLIMFTTRTHKTVAFNGLFLGLVVVVALVNGTVAS